MKSLLETSKDMQYENAIFMLEGNHEITESEVDLDGNNILHMIADRTITNTKNDKLISLILTKTPKECFNAKNDEGKTPLHLAFSQNNVTGAFILINAGAKMEKIGVDKYHNNVFHVIASIPSINDDLINKAFDLPLKDLINAKNDEGQTPLRLAYSKNNQRVVGKLTKNGANIDKKEEYGNGNKPLRNTEFEAISHYDLPEQKDNKAPTEILTLKDLEVAIKTNKQDKAVSLLKTGEEFNFEVFVDEDGNNLLHKIGQGAISNNELVELIVKKAPIKMFNAKNKKDFTPAEVALDEGNYTEARLLVNAGSKIHLEKSKDEDDNNLLHRLSLTFPFEMMDLIKLLAELAPSEIINAKNKDGKTPIDLIMHRINELSLDTIVYKSHNEKTMLNILLSREDITFDKNEALKNYIIKEISSKDNIIDKLPLIKVLAKNGFVKDATEWVKLIAWDFISPNSKLSVLDLVTILVKDNIIETTSLVIPNNPPLQQPSIFLEYTEKSKVESTKNEAKLLEQKIFSYLRTAQDHLKILNFTIPLYDKMDVCLLLELLESQVNTMSKSSLVELNKLIYQTYCETKTFDNLAEIFNTDMPLETKHKELLELQGNFNYNDVLIFQILAGAELGGFDLTNHNDREKFKIYLGKTLDGIKKIKSMYDQMDKICHLGLYEYILKLNFLNLEFDAYKDKVDKIFADGRDSKLKQDLVVLLQILTKQENPFVDQNNNYESEKKFMATLRNKPIKVILEELNNVDLDNIDPKDATLITTIVDNIKINLENQSPMIKIDILNLPICNIEFVIEDQEFVKKENIQVIEQNVINFDQQQTEEKEVITDTNLTGVLFEDGNLSPDD